jgi:hypothetical protein
MIFSSTADFRAIVSAGGVPGSDVTLEDVKAAKVIWGRSFLKMNVGHNRVSRTKLWKDRCLGRTKYPRGTLGSARLGSKRGTGEIKRDWS